MQAKNDGIKIIKGTNYNFNDFNSFISNIPAHSTLTWNEEPNSWKTTSVLQQKLLQLLYLIIKVREL